jgi:hypothetical protein
MTRTIVATFPSTAAAEAAAATLEAAGIHRGQIQVLDSAAVRQYEERSTAERRAGGGFWGWLFGDVESETERGFPEADAT